jgi:hypothetical protein
MGMGMKPLVKEKGVGVPFLEGVVRIFLSISKNIERRLLDPKFAVSIPHTTIYRGRWSKKIHYHLYREFLIYK